MSDKFEPLAKINDADFEVKFENFQAIHHTEKNMHYGLSESLLHTFFDAMSKNESILVAESIIDTWVFTRFWLRKDTKWGEDEKS